MPPTYWMHDINMDSYFVRSIKTLLLWAKLPIPYHWHENDMTIFDQACFGEIPDITGHKSDEVNED